MCGRRRILSPVTFTKIYSPTQELILAMQKTYILLDVVLIHVDTISWLYQIPYNLNSLNRERESMSLYLKTGSSSDAKQSTCPCSLFLFHCKLVLSSALSRLKVMWRDKNNSLASKVKLMRTLILSAFLYACEDWPLTAEIDRRIQALEMRCYRRLFNISYKDHVTNEGVRNRIQNAIGVHDDLLTMVKKRKLRWYGHISRSSDMAKTILQGTVKGARRRERQKRWEDNKEWTGMGFGDSLWAAEDREGWKGIVVTSSVVPRRPPRLRDWDEMRWETVISLKAI